MNQLQKARIEIALFTLDELYPPFVRFGGTIKHHECTKIRPMPLFLAYIDRWQHPEDMVREINSNSDYYARYKCDACGYKWESELPQ